MLHVFLSLLVSNTGTWHKFNTSIRYYIAYILYKEYMVYRLYNNEYWIVSSACGLQDRHNNKLWNMIRHHVWIIVDLLKWPVKFMCSNLNSSLNIVSRCHIQSLTSISAGKLSIAGVTTRVFLEGQLQNNKTALKV